MKQQTILITGCSTGIGRALVQAFVNNGDQVIATARRLDAIADLQSSNCEIYPLDVNAAASRHALFEQLSQRAGPIDMLVHNAGISAMGPLLELPEAALRGQFETNVLAPVLLTQKLFPLMRKSARPVIVNLGSVSGILTTPFAGAYCASKAALHAISDALRMELAPFGFQVVTVQPGGIQSNFGAAATQSVKSWLKDDSLYAPIRKSIMARAGASQVKATSADAFAATLLRQLKQRKLPRETRIGHGSQRFPALKKYLPAQRLDRLLSRRFGLDRLK